MSFQKTYLILGASSDLGLELIRQLNQSEENVLFLAHYNSCSEKIMSIAMDKGNELKALRCDLANPEGVENLISEIRAVVDAPTHIVHLAAPSFLYTKLKDFDGARFFRSMQIQVVSFLSIVRAFLSVMIKRKEHDKIVAVLSSVTEGKPPRQLLEYTAVKHALWGAVKSLASDTEGKMLNVNAVSPSMIDTKFLDGIDSRIVQMNAEASPEGRIAGVGDIVPAIRFLLSSGADYLHGVNMNVSNGSVFG